MSAKTGGRGSRHIVHASDGGEASDCHRRFCLVCEKEKSKNTRSPYCVGCAREAKKNPALVHHYRASRDPAATIPKQAPKPWFRGDGSAAVDLASGSAWETATFVADNCPRGWQWAVFCDGLECELRIGHQRERAFVVFDGTAWVIKHPRTWPHPLAFKDRDQALKEAVSLAAATLPLDPELIKRERMYRKQVETHLGN
jgi:hypothetical protein